jgi:hypothetical protein
MPPLFFQVWGVVLCLLFCLGGQASAQVLLIHGRVESVNTVKSPTLGRYGFHLFVRDFTTEQLYFIHVAPQWYVENHPEKFNFHLHDVVAILGTQFTTQLTPNNIAASTIVNYSNDLNMLSLRDPTTGAILWNNQPKNLANIIYNTRQQSLKQTTQQLGQAMQERAQSATDQVQVHFVPAASPPLPLIPPWLRQTAPQP